MRRCLVSMLDEFRLADPFERFTFEQIAPHHRRRDALRMIDKVVTEAALYA